LRDRSTFSQKSSNNYLKDKKSNQFFDDEEETKKAIEESLKFYKFENFDSVTHIYIVLDFKLKLKH
jgi:hypothetical protein